jgi:virginiamycin B lyase
MKVALALVVAASTLATVAQTPGSEWNAPKPGVKEVQVSFASLKPSATIKIGKTADWVLVTEDAVWVASTKPNAVVRISPATNRIVATVAVSGEACSGLMTCGGGSVWTLNQGDGTVSRVDEKSRKVTATIQAGIPGAGGDIDYGAESVWPTAQGGVPLTRIDSTTNKVVRQWVGKGGDSLRLGFGSIWITDYKQGLLLRIPVPQLLKQGT